MSIHGIHENLVAGQLGKTIYKKIYRKISLVKSSINYYNAPHDKN